MRNKKTAARITKHCPELVEQAGRFFVAARVGFWPLACTIDEAASPTDIESTESLHMRAKSDTARVQPALHTVSVKHFAARIHLRAVSVGYCVGQLQKGAAVLVSLVAWVLFLVGLAHFLIAAMQQQTEQLGASLLSTARGTNYGLAALLLLFVALPQWVMGQRRLETLLRHGESARRTS
ncbi:MAG TPA: hypothetical protein PKE31_16195 [Pseudomonadota bacterium]|nr:hypothetical protein [Pseudomonadota bacterium]